MGIRERGGVERGSQGAEPPAIGERAHREPPSAGSLACANTAHRRPPKGTPTEIAFISHALRKGTDFTRFLQGASLNGQAADNRTSQQTTPRVPPCLPLKCVQSQLKAARNLSPLNQRNRLHEREIRSRSKSIGGIERTGLSQ